MAGHGSAPARAALVGNPSDGYGGRVVTLAVPHFAASVEALDHDAAPLSPGLARLVGAAQAVFGCHAERLDRTIGEAPRGWRCRTTVPRQVGLGGSSAVVVAALRALSAHHDVAIDRPTLASMALAAETEVLGVPAGLQDRVAQAYGTLVDVDVSPAACTERSGWVVGRYAVLDQAALPTLWLAWRASGAESSAVVHGDLRSRFDAGEPAVVTAMQELGRLASRAVAAIAAGEGDQLGALMDASVDIRTSIVEPRPDHIALVDAARAVRGVHVNYAGSGGAVVGTAPADRLDDLAAAMGDLGAGWLVLPSARSRKDG